MIRVNHRFTLTSNSMEEGWPRYTHGFLLYLCKTCLFCYTFCLILAAVYLINTDAIYLIVFYCKNELCKSGVKLTDDF